MQEGKYQNLLIPMRRGELRVFLARLARSPGVITQLFEKTLPTPGF